MTDKQKTKLYYRLEAKESNLKLALRETRQEPVFGLQSIANVIKKSLDEAEVEVLRKHLKNKKINNK